GRPRRAAPTVRSVGHELSLELLNDDEYIVARRDLWLERARFRKRRQLRRSGAGVAEDQPETRERDSNSAARHWHQQHQSTPTLSQTLQPSPPLPLDSAPRSATK